jgi:hypothetical protein
MHIAKGRINVDETPELKRAFGEHYEALLFGQNQ